MINPFFKNNGPFSIDKLLSLLEINDNKIFNKILVYDIKDLVSASNKDISFFHSKKYEPLAAKTKAAFCLTTSSLSDFLPDTCD